MVRRPRAAPGALACLVLVLISPATLSATGKPPARDAAMVAGGRLFQNCIACHTLARGATHSVGPNLSGVFGSTAGTKPDFPYSDAMASSGIVWSAETVGRFIEKPAAVVPGTSMAFVGMPKEDDRRVLLAYLARMTAAP